MKMKFMEKGNNSNFIIGDQLNFDIRFYPYPHKKLLESVKRGTWNSIIILVIIIILLILEALLIFRYYHSSPYMPIISFSFTPLITWLFIITWDKYNLICKEKIYFEAFMSEIKNNIEFLNANIETLRFEQRNLFNYNSDTSFFEFEPIFSLQFDIWDSLKQNISLGSLKMDNKELETFFYDSRRFNEVIPLRNNVKKFDFPLEARISYNNALLLLGIYALEHLFNALKSRGNIISYTRDDLKHFDDFDDFINELSDYKLCVSTEMYEEIKNAYLDFPDNITIYSYTK